MPKINEKSLEKKIHIQGASLGARGGEVLGGTKPTFSQPNNGPDKLMKPFSSKIWLKLIFKFAEKKSFVKKFFKNGKSVLYKLSGCNNRTLCIERIFHF